MAVRARFPVWWLAVLGLILGCAVPRPSAARAEQQPFPQGQPQPHPAQRHAAAARGAAAKQFLVGRLGFLCRRHPAPPPRPDTVALPYNLVWFDNQSRLASLFAGVSAKVTEKKTDGPSEIWTVKELIAPNLRTSFFTFQQGMLVGLEFDYGQDAWDDGKYNEVMGQFRRLLETKCESPGEIISRKTDQAPGTTIKETLMGYQWVRGDTNVQLFYYSAEDTAKALNFRSISVHYHYRDPYAPPPGSEPANNNAPLPPPPGAQPSPGGSAATSITVTPAGPDNAPGGTLPLPDNAPPGSSPAPSPAPTPAPSPMPTPTPDASAVPSLTPTPTATPASDQLPGSEPVEIKEDGDAAAAMSPAPSPEAAAIPTPGASPDASPTPTPSPTPSATPTPTPSPTPKKSSGRKKKG